MQSPLERGGVALTVRGTRVCTEGVGKLRLHETQLYVTTSAGPPIAPLRQEHETQRAYVIEHELGKPD